MEERYNNLKIAEHGARISIGAYIILSFLKLGIGYFTGSKALFADGLNNATDILSSVAVLIGLKIARKPADEEHSYGHFRAETISSLIASLIMIAVGIDVLVRAIKDTLFFEPKAPDLLAAFTAIVCAIGIYFVYLYNKKIALRINSAGLLAAAKDNLSDAWVSLGAAVGIIASQFGMPWIDPLAAVIVGILILKTGWEIFLDASHNLSDGYDRESLNDITLRIEAMEGVEGILDIKARMHGNMTIMDLIILVNPHISVIEGHDIAEMVEKMLHQEFNISEVIIHVEPNLPTARP